MNELSLGGVGMVELLILVPLVAVLLWALVDAIRRPGDKMRYLPKWAWILIILFGNTLGQVVYLIVGRDNSKPVAETAGATAGQAKSAADALYGTSKDLK